MGIAIANKHIQQTKPLGWRHAALCALMLALFMYSGSLLNGQVYSFVAGYFGWSREIATLCGALTFLAIGMAARMAPSLLDVRSITALAILFMLIQPPLFAIAANTQDPLPYKCCVKHALYCSQLGIRVLHSVPHGSPKSAWSLMLLW